MRNVILFTKPYARKQMYVKITYDKKKQLYELTGISISGQKIREQSEDSAMVLQRFYHELCWMINQKVMLNTSIQRSMPKTALKKYSK